MTKPISSFDERTVVLHDFVRQYGRRILLVAQNIVGNPDDAEEIVQEAYLKAYVHLGEFEGRSQLYTWVVRIVVNEGLIWLRKRKRRPEVAIDDSVVAARLLYQVPTSIPDPEQSYLGKELRTTLDTALRRLPVHLHSAFRLRYVDGLPGRRAAEVLNVSVPALKSRAVRARAVLRQALVRSQRDGHQRAA